MDEHHLTEERVKIQYVFWPPSTNSAHSSHYASSSAPSLVHGESNPPSDNSAGVPTIHRRGQPVMEFVRNTQGGLQRVPFEVHNSSLVQMNFGRDSDSRLLQQVFIKRDLDIASKGKIIFEPAEIYHGNRITTASPFVRATSSGDGAQLYLADSDKQATVLELNGESMTVRSANILAFEASLSHKIVVMPHLCRNLPAGLFMVQLSGHGCVVIVSRGKPLTLLVQDGEPVVRTNPEATVAWSSDLKPDFETNVQSMGSFERRTVPKQLKRYLLGGSDESTEMTFDPKKGRGFVVVAQTV